VAKAVDLPQGALEMLILKAASLEPLHGDGILVAHSADFRRVIGDSLRFVLHRH
jgi:hypothetical protein